VIQHISAACIVSNGKILLVKQRKQNKWSLPKGKGYEEETTDETLIREVREETSLDISSLRISKSKSFSYISKFGNIKSVRLYFIKCNSISQKVLDFSSKEIEKVVLVDFNEGVELLNKHYKKAILE
jgi:8-oxo-dGTP pyrophosphatase MutT (NUDIX family)